MNYLPRPSTSSYRRDVARDRWRVVPDGATNRPRGRPAGRRILRNRRRRAVQLAKRLGPRPVVVIFRIPVAATFQDFNDEWMIANGFLAEANGAQPSATCSGVRRRAAAPDVKETTRSARLSTCFASTRFRNSRHARTRASRQHERRRRHAGGLRSRDILHQP